MHNHIMRTDAFDQVIVTELDLISMVLSDPSRTFSTVLVEPGTKTTTELELKNFPVLEEYQQKSISVEEFDRQNQMDWLMPPEYKSMDIAHYVLSLCSTDHELQRAGEELIRYQELDAFDLLRYLKYLVDTMRERGILWGVGRGSSVASYVLYLLGVHRIDSLYYSLDYREFLR